MAGRIIIGRLPLTLAFTSILWWPRLLLLKLLAKLMVEHALVVILIVGRSDLAIMSTRASGVNVGENVGWIGLLKAIVGPVLWRKRGRARGCKGTKAGFIVPGRTRRSRSREMIQERGLGSRGWLEVEEGGFVDVYFIENGSPRCAIILGLLWFHGMIVGGCIAKRLDEIVVLGNVTGKHVGGAVRIR